MTQYISNDQNKVFFTSLSKHTINYFNICVVCLCKVKARDGELIRPAGETSCFAHEWYMTPMPLISMLLKCLYFPLQQTIRALLIFLLLYQRESGPGYFKDKEKGKKHFTDILALSLLFQSWQDQWLTKYILKREGWHVRVCKIQEDKP